MTRVGRPAVLLDRDGTLNVNPSNYVTSIDLLQPIPGSFEAVGRLTRAGWPVVVVTNQACIGKGLATAESVNDVHDECRRLASTHGGSFEGFYVCPHVPDAGCTCRKPLPGLLLSAAQDLDLDLFRSYMVGDTIRDVLAGRAAGATSLWVRTGNDPEPPDGHALDLAFDDLASAADWILERG